MIFESKKIICLFCLCFFCFAAFGYAEDSKTDIYAPVYEKPLKPTPLKDAVSQAIAFPFELIKWPIDQGLMLIEDNRLDRKAKWLYEQGVQYGFTPRLDSLDFSGIPSYGADFDLIRIARQRDDYPDLIARSWINHGPASYFQTGAELGVQRIADTGFHVSELFQYENRRDETFYGIGPHSSLGDSTSYIKEDSTLETKLGYEFSPTLDLFSKFSYDHVNIKNRSYHGKGEIISTFTGREDIPGVHGDDLLGYSMGLNRDTRDSKSDATKGSYQKLLFKFTNGTESSKARYFTYQADLAKYFQLASPRRILVTRFFAEHNQTVNGGDVPFYNMAKMGGSGSFPRESLTNRGFVYNRYYGQSALLFNVEYRYTIWQYKEFKMNTAAFVDEGQVFGDLKKMNFKNFRTSYGGGLHLSYSQNLLLHFTVAHSAEGTQFYVENEIPF